MIGRLVGVLGLLLALAGFVLLPAGPASASCAFDQPADLADNAQVAFVGVLDSQRADDDVVAHRFTVSTVLTGKVHRTPDVVTPRDSSVAVEWNTGDEMLVLAYLDEGRLASNVCMGSATAADPSYDTVLAELGTSSEPLAGRSVVELSVWNRDDVRWFMLAVGVIGLVALGVQVGRGFRARE